MGTDGGTAVAKQSKDTMTVVDRLPDDRAIFINEERPTMMYVGKRSEDKPGWRKTTEIPANRVLKQTSTGMYVLASK